MAETTGRVKKGRKPTAKEKEARIAKVIHLIGLGRTDWQIKAECKGSFDVDHSTVGRYLHQARTIIKDGWYSTGRTKEVMASESMEWYANVIGDDCIDIRNRLKARERMDKLQGIEAPEKQAQTDVAGNDVLDLSKMTDTQIDRILGRNKTVKVSKAKSNGKVKANGKLNGHARKS